MFVFSVNLSIKCLQIRSDIIMFSFKAYCQIEDFFSVTITIVQIKLILDAYIFGLLFRMFMFCLI